MWKSGNAPRREAASAPPPPPATRAKRKFEILTWLKKSARRTIICHFSARREFDIFTRPKRFKFYKKYKQQVMESKKTCDTFQCKYKVGMKAKFQCKYHKTVQEQIQGEKPNLGTFRFSEWLWNTLTTGEPIVNPPLFSPRLPTHLNPHLHRSHHVQIGTMLCLVMSIVVLIVLNPEKKRYNGSSERSEKDDESPCIGFPPLSPGDQQRAPPLRPLLPGASKGVLWRRWKGGNSGFVSYFPQVGQWCITNLSKLFAMSIIRSS